MYELELLLGQTVEHSCSSLVITNEKDFLYIIVSVVVVVLFAQLVLDLFDHGRDVVHAYFRKGKVPIVSRISLDVKLQVALAVACASVIAKPDVVPGLPESDWHWNVALTILMEPRIS